MKLPRYLAVADKTGRLALLVQRDSGRIGNERGSVLNGSWPCRITFDRVYVIDTNRSWPGHVVWRGNRIREQHGDYGFGYIAAEIAAGRNGMTPEHEPNRQPLTVMEKAHLFDQLVVSRQPITLWGDDYALYERHLRSIGQLP